MAAVTPSSLSRHSCGDLTLYIAQFAATVDNGDIWTSKIPGIVGVMGCQADASGTQAATGGGAALTTASTGAITIYLAEDNTLTNVWVLAQS